MANGNGEPTVTLSLTRVITYLLMAAGAGGAYASLSYDVRSLRTVVTEMRAELRDVHDDVARIKGSGAQIQSGSSTAPRQR